MFGNIVDTHAVGVWISSEPRSKQALVGLFVIFHIPCLLLLHGVRVNNYDMSVFEWRHYRSCRAYRYQSQSAEGQRRCRSICTPTSFSITTELVGGGWFSH
ncbi:unnamed protein product [Ectocarpus sp. 4 AP-2014]